MSLGKVSIAIEAQMANFESDMGRAARVAEKEFKKIERDAKRTQEQMKQLGKAAGVAIVAGLTAATVAIKSSINAMDDLSKAAQRVGMSTEAFSALAYAGGLADVSIQDLQSSLGKLAKSQAMAMDSGSKQAKVFAALGISVQDANGNLRDTEAVFADLADAYQRQNGSPEIIAAGMELTGRSFQNLIPLIKGGSEGLREATDEAAKFGQVISTEAGNAAEAFNDNLSRLGMLATGLANAVAADLLPDLERLTDEFVDSASSGDGLSMAANDISNAIRVAAGLVEAAWYPFKRLGEFAEGAAMAFVGFAEAAKGVANLDWGQIQRGMAVAQGGADVAYYGNEDGASSGPRADFSGVSSGASGAAVDRATVAKMRAASAEAKRLREMAFGPTPKGAGSKGAKAGKSDAEREAEQLEKAYGSLIASQLERIALFGKEDEVSRVTYEMQSGSLKGLTEGQQAAAIAQASKLDMMEKDAEALKDAIRLEEEKTEASNRQADSVAQFIKDQEFELALLGMTNIERERAIALRYANVEAASKEGQTIIDNINRINEAAKGAAFLEDFKRGLADMFVDFASGAKSAKEAFGDFADSLFKRALQFVADKAIEAMFSAFSGGGKQGGGSAGGGWGGVISAVMGAFGGGRAMGGPVSGGSFYEVGEMNRPEMFSSGGKSYLIPGNDGAVSPMRGGGGVQQVNHFNYAAPYDARTEVQKNAKLAYLTARASARNG